ncbi:MAG: hypothetical protein AAB036_01660 [Elusimicrobiota bacterium]
MTTVAYLAAALVFAVPSISLSRALHAANTPRADSRAVAAK